MQTGRRVSLEKNDYQVTGGKIFGTASEVCPSFCTILESTSDAWSSCRYEGSTHNGPHAAACYWPLSNRVFECSNQCECPDVCLCRMADRCLLSWPCLFPTASLLPALFSWLLGIGESTPIIGLSSMCMQGLLREGMELPRPWSRSGAEERPSSSQPLKYTDMESFCRPWLAR